MLKGKQHKLDKNKDGKISGADFKMMNKGGSVAYGKPKGYKHGGSVAYGKPKGYTKGGAVCNGGGSAIAGTKFTGVK